jgi:diaminohydroxyphosphoribosylaminopyrimidine deaminase/5-amino-6-(5-phosphoribosylamino)uracil reductase
MPSATFDDEDFRFMKRALHLAQKGLWTTTPNPRVGCVITRDGKILGEGYHRMAGGPHAEIEALRQIEDAKGATVYVTLEPCSHYGRTPPCADALIQAGVQKVIAAMVDPNPLVAGQGLAKLQAAGIEAVAGLLEEKAQALNPGYIKRMIAKRPWVRLKLGVSLDGRVALKNGASRWITNEKARLDVQHLRARSCAVLTGIGTVLADDCQLSVRQLKTTRQPWRIVLDPSLRTPPHAKVLSEKTMLFCKVGQLKPLPGAEVIEVPEKNGQLALPVVLEMLAQRGINELLLECGPKLAGAFLAEGLVDELILYYAPKLLGDTAKAMLELPELTSLQEAWQFQLEEIRRLGDNVRMILRKKPCLPD